MRRAAGAHVVLSMNFEKTRTRGPLQPGEMFRLEADPGAARQHRDMRGGKRLGVIVLQLAGAHRHRPPPGSNLDQLLNSLSWPNFVGEDFEAVFSQLPFGTDFQALLW